MAGDLAAAADPGVLLNLHKGTDLRLVSNLAAVEIDELRETYVLAQLYVVCDAIEGAYR